KQEILNIDQIQTWSKILFKFTTFSFSFLVSWKIISTASNKRLIFVETKAAHHGSPHRKRYPWRS
ncbi:MAG: hypothetical protein ACPH4K_03610, partial [Flavobacteriaceae bacterium]